MSKIKIAPSILSCDFAHLGDEVARCEAIGSDLIHIDVLDGNFAPNISIGAPVVAAVREYSKLPFDVHLMISHPRRFVDDFVKAGADIITFHLGAKSPVEDTLDKILNRGCKAGIALSPKFEATYVLPYLHRLSMVTVMTVEPGFSGQSFMEDQLDKVRQIRKYCNKKGLDIDIQVDGGINSQTIKLAADAGANVFVAGNAVFKAENPEAAVTALREAAQG